MIPIVKSLGQELPGAFKVPTLRNIAITAPYMHDGSIETLEDVVVHYMNGGVTDAGDPVNDFLSGGIRELNIEVEQIEDLVAFMDPLIETSKTIEPVQVIQQIRTAWWL